MSAAPRDITVDRGTHSLAGSSNVVERAGLASTLHRRELFSFIPDAGLSG